MRARSRRVLAGVAAVLSLPIVAPTLPAQARPAAPDAWWVDALQVPQAHERTRGAGVTIALVDTMVDPTVPDLAGADVVPVANFCGVDYEGLLRLGGRPDPATATIQGVAADHATSMAALMVGQGSGNGPGGWGIPGIAPEATVRTYATANEENGDYECDGDGRSGALAVAAAVEQAVADGVDIISISLDPTGSGGGAMLDSIGEAIDAGVVVVAGAGNGGTAVPAHPWRDGVVVVNGLTRQGQVSESSSRGITSVVSGPGEDIACGAWTPSGWDSAAVSDGTSQATAIVSAALALVKSAYPDATGNQLVQHVVRHTTEETLSHSDELGFGVVSLTEMLASDPARWADVNPIVEVGGVRPRVVDQYPDALALASASTPSATAGATPEPSGQDAPATQGAAPVDEEVPGTGRPSVWALGLGAGVLALVAAGVLLARRRRPAGARPGRPDAGPPPDEGVDATVWSPGRAGRDDAGGAR